MKWRENIFFLHKIAHKRKQERERGDKRTCLPRWKLLPLSLSKQLGTFFSGIALEQCCCKKRQKSPGQETGLENRGRLKVLNDTKLALNEHE